MRKKSLAVVLTLVMLLGLFPATALADEPGTEEPGTEEPPRVVAASTEVQGGLGSVYDVQPAPMFQTLDLNGSPAFSWTGIKAYYNQLDPDSKTFYDALYSSEIGANYDATTHQVTISVSKTWENVPVEPVEGKPNTYSLADGNPVEVWVAATVTPGWLALIYDYPELSWLVNAGFQYGPEYQFTDGKVTDNGDGTYSAGITLTGISVLVTNYSAETGTAKDYADALDVAKTTLEQDGGQYDIDAADKTDYDMVKAIHDYVCNTVTYADEDLSPRKYQTVYSALATPYTTVCAGYSKAFKVLCDAYNIPCVLVSGTGNSNGSPTKDDAHMWNYVRMDDNNWYAVDCTWDDSGNLPVPATTFFLVGSGTTDGSVRFDASHWESGQWSDGNYTFAYPTLNSTAYVKQEPITGTVTITGTPKIDVELTATASGMPGGATLKYQWYRGETPIAGATGATYIPNEAADVGKTIKVVVTADGYSGQLEASTIETVARADTSAPSTPTEVSHTHDTITINTTAGQEYTCITGDSLTGSEQWQDSGIFTGLTASTAYKIYARVAATGTHNASDASTPLEVTTKAAPINAVTVNVTAPAKGGTPATTAMVSAPGSGVTVSKVEWYVGSEKFDGLTFNAATVYTVKITLTAEGEITFAAEVTAEGYTVERSSDTEIVLSKTFEATSDKDKPTCTAPADVTATYGQTLSEISLDNPDGNTPGTWSWTDDSQLVGNVGSHTFTATFTPTDTDNYVTVENIPVTVTVRAKSISDVAIGDIVDQEHTGSAITPVVTVTGDGGKTLVPNQDYTVEYSNNTNVGVATVTVKAKAEGNYTFSEVSKNFNIVAQAGQITISGNLNKTYDGTPVQPDETLVVDKHGSGGAVSYKYYTNAECTTGETETAPADAGTYWVKAFMAADATYGSAISNPLMFTISKATLTADGTGIASGTYGDKLSELTVSGLTAKLNDQGILGTWKLTGDTVPNVGDSGSYTATFTPTTGEGNYQPLTAQVTLSIAKAVWDGGTAASGSAKYGTTGTVDLSALIASGGTASAAIGTDTNSVLNGTPSMSGTVLSFTLTDGVENVDKTATISVSVSEATNYNDYTITVTITVTDKLVPTLTVNPITVTYNRQPVPASAITGTAKVGDTVVPGTWSWGGSKIPTNVQDSDLYPVLFTPDDPDTYAGTTALVDVTINKATPTGTPTYTAITTSGKTLGDANLQIGSITPGGGQITWVEGNDRAVLANIAYYWTYVPQDTNNYNNLTGSITPWVQSTNPGGNTGGSTGGSSSGSTGSSDSSGSTSVSTPSTSGNTTTVTAEVKPAVSGSTATATISASNLEKAVDSVMTAAANRGTAPVVEIAVDTPNRADSLEVSLPTASLEKLGRHAAASLVITSGVAEVTLDSSAISAVADQAGSRVTLSVEPVSRSELNSLQRAIVGDASVLDLRLISGGQTITSFRGGSATVTVPYELPSGVSANEVTVWYLDDNGTMTACDTTYDSRAGLVTFTTSHFSLYVIGTESGIAAFGDVPASHWAYSEITWANTSGYMTGKSAGTFDPNGSVTRQQVWMILARLAGAAPADMTAAKTWAVDNGISDGSNPGAAVTRQQLAALVYRFAQKFGYNTAGSADLSIYPDAATLPEYAAAPLAWAVANGIVTGTTQGTLNGGGTATRAQFAVILWRFVENTQA